jgi:hypothetical protein
VPRLTADRKVRTMTSSRRGVGSVTGRISPHPGARSQNAYASVGTDLTLPDLRVDGSVGAKPARPRPPRRWRSAGPVRSWRSPPASSPTPISSWTAGRFTEPEPLPQGDAESTRDERTRACRGTVCRYAGEPDSIGREAPQFALARERSAGLLRVLWPTRSLGRRRLSAREVGSRS